MTSNYNNFDYGGGGSSIMHHLNPDQMYSMVREEMQYATDSSPYSYYAQQQSFPNVPSNDMMARRYSSPQMGYYDLITGEYRYRSDNYNQSPLTSSHYAGETEPPMCENTCKWCQIKLPFNCLTISLITCLMLLIMFGLFQAILSTSSSKNPINTSLFSDMILLMSSLTVIFFVLTIVRYICIEKFHCCNSGICQRFSLLSSVIGDVFSTNTSKHISYGDNSNIGEEYV